MPDAWIRKDPMRWCSICKIFCQNNKISIERHENGIKHKENVQKKIREAEQKTKNDAKAEQDLRLALLQMEAGANKSMGIRVPNAATIPSGGIGPQIPGISMPTTAPVSGPTTSMRRKGDEYTLAKEELKRNKQRLKDLKRNANSQLWSDTESNEEQIQWVKAVTELGQIYYWNKFTMETQWNPPDRYCTTTEHVYPAHASNSTGYITHHYPAHAVNSSGYVAPTRYGGTVSTKLPRFDEPFDHQPPKITFDFKPRKVESKEDIRPDLISFKEPDFSTLPNKPQRHEPFGPWIPVQKKESERPQLVIDDLPEEAKKKQEDKAELEIDKSELIFAEKTAPVEIRKKPKAVEFRKKKANISVRSRMEG